MIKSNILALDASTEALSLVLHYQGKTFHHFEECPQQHSQKILPLIDELLNKANCKLKDLDVIGFGQGPGSFTGVRISVAIAQGLGYSTNLPLVGVSTLAVMAQQAFEQFGDEVVYPSIDARMGEIYFAQYQVNNNLMTLQGEERVFKPELLDASLIDTNKTATGVGTGFKSYPDALTTFTNVSVHPEITLPDAQYMLALVDAQYLAGNGVKASDAQPKYVRDTVTWKKLPGRE
ncbi:MAG: tRNA threonylcarbamoyladenosine biosynthesis protein TsaB [Pseudoalteromonas tetraodonis]|jgi:tRNA threonylcarbamoyladenosine biosynthesis protein TsaB|uniref:tRNA threonylcarbamoyladenosine biosynthesis protein TsaB n=1 Tax=Pseudoalteromonas tetraodonis GFC TaxID=1315271 RepID=A0AA37W3K6_9GAMM|nr:MULTISPECIES: tRNA (adenosine(37)-N6)-threonylcarbamoyltransferase complex dimerization subunit type 1 TsaB [Pseudoalteromonas]PHQ96120.1 MAG: tRNA (adenosine(37)-N6)-threonylcarbamoyltransferase complex dimerization subunit type 1 TsaB [Pseudoalteromonas sp.]ALQ56824.1 Putative protease [Pseudoalteromonas issachenkonii]MDN3435699.1 tRNA (adenosine(37)-N6)-threonylcarbamoyltransferase complex dimerization subunit type 1 TsaB [Pseudoalteromonas sp. APC 3356]TMS93862.1 tRNA (adenosine(37)-N6)-|tara:strand:- start:381 stop:1082 length:702 start_codon:yes stop_codon:yes gene_type:complete